MKELTSATNTTMGESMLHTGHVVKDKWQVVSKIGQGAFGEVYKCKDFTSNRQVALKLVSKEKIQSASHLLKLEVTVLKELKGKHYFPKFVGFGKTERFDYLVMELLGPSLSELKKHQPDRRFSLSTTLRLGHMMLKCIHSIHKAGYLHRDIKPSNFTIGLGEDNRRRVYLLDFGLARQYVLENGEVRPPRYKVSFHGTPRYASLRVLQGKEAGRQDDLMSLFYTLSEFFFRDLPWKNIRDYREMADAKEVFDHQVLVKEFPDEFQDFFNHISELTFFDKPDYDLLYSLFDRCIKRRGVKDTDPFDFEENGGQKTESQLRKDNTSTVPTKSSSEVQIIDCASFEESEKQKAKEQIKRSKSTSNNLNRLVPTAGLEEMRKEQLLRSKSSNNMMNKKNLSNNNNNKPFFNNSKDTGFSVSPFSTNSHCHPSISISVEPESPVNKPNLILPCEESKTKLKSQCSVESNKCSSQQTESLFMDSLSKDNCSFETSKVENTQLNKFLKKSPTLQRSPCINTLSTLRCFKDKNKKPKTRHSVRRSVSHPASIPSHLLIKSIFHDSSKAQGQQGLPRCWSCPTISHIIRSDLKPPLKQQASFDENVYEVDVMRNVAAKQLADEPVHVDGRRNSLPFIHTLKPSTKESSEGLILNNISDSGIASLSVTRRAEVSDSVIPDVNRRSISKEFEKSIAIQEAKVQKSLSDSNVYQRSFNNNLRVKRDAQIRKSVLFAPIENEVKIPTKIVDHCDMIKHMASLSVEPVDSISHSKSESNDQYPSKDQPYKYLTAEQNDEIIKEESLVLEKADADLEVQNITSETMNRKSLMNNSECDKKDNTTINDSKIINEKNNVLENNLDNVENLISCCTTNIQTAGNNYKTDYSAEIEKNYPAKSTEIRDGNDIQINIPVVYVTENKSGNSQSLEFDTQQDTTNKLLGGNEVSNEVFTERNHIVEASQKTEEAFHVTESKNENSLSLEVDTQPDTTNKLFGGNEVSNEIFTEKNHVVEASQKTEGAFHVTESKNDNSLSLEVDTQQDTTNKLVGGNEVSNEVFTEKNHLVEASQKTEQAFHEAESNNENSQSLEVNSQQDTANKLVGGNEVSNEVFIEKNHLVELSQKTEDACKQNQVSRRHRANSENKYVKDESELKLQFSRRRQRPSSVIYETKDSSECSEKYEPRSIYPYVGSFGNNGLAGVFHSQVASTSFELLQPPTDDPPSDYCLPSRRRRYRRAVTASMS